MATKQAEPASGARTSSAWAVDLRSISPRSVVFVVVGVALVVMAMATLRWYSFDAGADVAGEGFTFADLHQNADQLNTPVASWFFDWLAITLVVVVGLVGLAASVPNPLTDVLRVLGFLAGVIGAVGTYYSLAQIFNAQRAAGGSDHSVFHSSTFGLWAMLLGFVLAGIGAALGPLADAPARL